LFGFPNATIIIFSKNSDISARIISDNHILFIINYITRIFINSEFRKSNLPVENITKSAYFTFLTVFIYGINKIVIIQKQLDNLDLWCFQKHFKIKISVSESKS
jgi:hypothetical protein